MRDIQEIRETIRKRMKAKGLSQRKLSGLADMSESAVRDVLTRTNSPGITTLQKIAAALEVPIEELTGEQYSEAPRPWPRPWAPREDTISLVLESGLLPLTASHVPPDDLQLLAHAVTKGLQLVAAQPAMEDDPGFRKAVETTIANAIADYRHSPAQSA